MLLPLMFLAAVFAFLSVNNADVIAFRYLFIAFTCLQSVFIIIAYIILSKEVCLCDDGFTVIYLTQST